MSSIKEKENNNMLYNSISYYHYWRIFNVVVWNGQHFFHLFVANIFGDTFVFHIFYLAGCLFFPFFQKYCQQNIYHIYRIIYGISEKSVIITPSIPLLRKSVFLGIAKFFERCYLPLGKQCSSFNRLIPFGNVSLFAISLLSPSTLHPYKIIT